MKKFLLTMMTASLLAMAISGTALGLLHYCGGAQGATCAQQIPSEDAAVLLGIAAAVFGAVAVALWVHSVMNPKLPALPQPRLPQPYSEQGKPERRESNGYGWYYSYKIVSCIVWSPAVLLAISLGFAYATVAEVAPLAGPGRFIFDFIRDFVL